MVVFAVDLSETKFGAVVGCYGGHIGAFLSLIPLDSPSVLKLSNISVTQPRYIDFLLSILSLSLRFPYFGCKPSYYKFNLTDMGYVEIRMTCIVIVLSNVSNLFILVFLD